jgi:hypothetical protein
MPEDKTTEKQEVKVTVEHTTSSGHWGTIFHIHDVTGGKITLRHTDAKKVGKLLLRLTGSEEILKTDEKVEKVSTGTGVGIGAGDKLTSLIG